MNDYLKFEKNLSECLGKFGITYKNRYVVVTHGKTFELDLFISSPMRAFVECVFVNTQMGLGKRLLEHRSEMIKRICHEFRNTVIPFIVTNTSITDDIKLQFSKDVQFISINNVQENAGELVASKIHKFMLENVKTFKDKINTKDIFFLEPISKGGEFNELLLHFRTILKTAEYKILSKEIISLNEELESNHHTSAALRIGRTLEFIVFSLAKAWGVKINAPVIRIVDELTKDFKGVTNILVDYTYSEEKSKSEKKHKLKNQIKNISSKLMDLVFDIDNFEIQEEKKDDIPINYKTVLQEVKKKYSSNELIRTDMNIILNENYLNELQYLRNIAAHANISGKNREIDKKAVSTMIKNLKIILLSLSNINENIVKNLKS